MATVAKKNKQTNAKVKKTVSMATVAKVNKQTVAMATVAELHKQSVAMAIVAEVNKQTVAMASRDMAQPITMLHSNISNCLSVPV